MKTKLIAIFMTIVLCACLFAGCEPVVNTNHSDFVFIERDGQFEYVYHKDTGVIYVMYFDANLAAMTVMLNPDGTPMIWEGE